MDRIERGGEVDKTGGCRLLVTMAGFKDAPLCEYLVRISTPSTESDLVGPRPKVAHCLESPEKDNSEDFRSNVDKNYAPIVFASRLISLLVDRQKGTFSPVIRNNFLSRLVQSFAVARDGSLAAFSTRCSPCPYLITVMSDVKQISSLPDTLTHISPIWPIVLFHATSDKNSRVSGSSLVICRSDGSLAHLCTEGGGILTVAVGQADTTVQETRQPDLEHTGVQVDRPLAPESMACLIKFFDKEEYLSVDTSGAIRFWVASQDGARSIRRQSYVPSLRPVSNRRVLRPRMLSSRGVTHPTCISHLAASGRYVMVVGAIEGEHMFPVIICDTIDGSQLDHPLSEAHTKPIVDVASVRLRAVGSDTGGTQILFSTIAPNDIEGPLRIWTPEFHEYAYFCIGV
ncbi:unnamed protein product [Schistocephalus solidus]|uniref:Uncharacterized protein n=1 Tax=Schistocephalus solidus TaxID=70667 RepID=A0A183SQS2_SCHSO|nr:unnamed protein product [Schistocephalus solidus]